MYELVLVYLVLKQVIEIVIQDICQYGGVELKIVIELLACKIYIVLDKFIYELVLLPNPSLAAIVRMQFLLCCLL